MSQDDFIGRAPVPSDANGILTSLEVLARDLEGMPFPMLLLSRHAEDISCSTLARQGRCGTSCGASHLFRVPLKLREAAMRACARTPRWLD